MALSLTVRELLSEVIIALLQLYMFICNICCNFICYLNIICNFICLFVIYVANELRNYNYDY